MDWKARVEIVQEVNQGDMQIGATMADADLPNGERVEYPWAAVYAKEALEQMTDQQVQALVVEDMTGYAQTIASSTSRIDDFKQFEGTIINLNVVL